MAIPDSIPGAPLIGETVSGEPFNPAGPDFADWLNDKLQRTFAGHWNDALDDDAGAGLEDHGYGFQLNGHTLTLDSVEFLAPGWFIRILGPGTIQPATGEGDAVVLSANAWADVGSDGTSLIVRPGGEVVEDVVQSEDIRTIVKTTQSAYDALDPPDGETLYLIVEA